MKTKTESAKKEIQKSDIKDIFDINIRKAHAQAAVLTAAVSNREIELNEEILLEYTSGLWDLMRDIQDQWETLEEMI